jgi:hypothetical protein
MMPFVGSCRRGNQVVGWGRTCSLGTSRPNRCGEGVRAERSRKTAVGTCLVLWFWVRRVLAGDLTSGALLVFILYLGKMYKPMKDLSKMTDTLSKAAIAFERIGEIMSIESQVCDVPGAKPAPPLKGRTRRM